MKRAMKNLLSNKRCCLVGMFLFIGVNASYSQILDWIGDQLKEYVDNKINSIAGYTDSQLGSFGRALWDGVVESELQDKLAERMQKLGNIEVPLSTVSSLDSKYGLSGEQNDFRDIYWSQSDLTKSFVYSVKMKSMSTLGNGSVRQNGQAYSESIRQNLSIASLRDIVSSEVMDSVAVYSMSNASIADGLLADIKANENILYILNNHPSAVRIYHNSFNIDKLRRSPKHLLYWSTQAKEYCTLLPKKKALPDVGEIKFEIGNGKVQISNNGTLLGEMSGSSTISCSSLELQNYRAMPNTTYIMGEIEWKTDAIGRVVSIKQVIYKGNNVKCLYKSKLKSKDFASIISTGDNMKPYNPADKKYGGAETLLNTFFFESTGENKKQLKQAKKLEKTALKQNGNCIKVVSIKYPGGSTIPSEMNISYDGLFGTATLTNNI